ncbi:hypothetical protein CRM22_008455 [Opisthorchis felineus]|uniref:Uncharacterized protein n=1 Tax=Opisthorchis felineus TaxID=147828 RepID=A0A4S2LB50_OPIFE|nr:hypothetical protein CRM22_008455 [Opisthorchis felineus]
MPDIAPELEPKSSRNILHKVHDKLSANRIFVGAFICTVGVIVVSSTVTAYFKTRARKLYSTNLINRTFEIDTLNDVFVKDNEEFQFISGSIHYFRIPRIYWLDRLQKARALGLDAVQIDIPWNFHERKEGEYTFDGMADVEHFIFTAQQQGLLVICRIGPYIGSDWSLGGLPPWLLYRYPHIKMRSSSAEFLAPVKRWFDVLLPRLKEHLYHKGGPVIMIQIENDYGSYAACDADYMGALNALVRQHLGPEVIVSTVDVGTKNHLKCGSPFKLNLATINFGPYKGEPDDRFLELFEFQPETPWVNSEYYTGWMDHWGYPHFQTEPKVFIDRLLDLLYYSPRISVNIYMFHGGTNFGFWNGAVDRPYSSQVSSYDYNAPLSEAGDITDFYIDLRQAILTFKNTSGMEVPRNTTKIAYDTIPMYLVSHLIEHVTGGSSAMVTVSMEAMEQYTGFMLYRTEFYRDAGQPVRLKFKDVADYAYIYTTSVNLDTLVFHGAISRNDRSLVFYFKPKFNTTDLLVLVENAGYATYNPKFYNDRKGIIGPVSADGRELLGWSFMPVCLNAESHSKCNWTLVDKITEKFISNVQKTAEQQNGGKRSWPTSGSIFAGILNIESFERLADTFVQPLNFTRGVLLVNNEVVGKYNQALGPQLRVYVPKNFLRVGTNIFILIELDSLWLNETMTSVKRSVGVSYPLLFDVQMQWHRTRDRSLQ